MSTADEWRARFFEQRWRAERDELWARVGADLPAGVGAANRPVVLVSGREAEPDGIDVSAPAGARRVGSAALAAGWAVRIVESVAAVPRTGILRVVTVRGARHDERFWAAWWNGRFECAQYLVRGCAIERLGFRTTKTRRGVMDAIEGRRLESM